MRNISLLALVGAGLFLASTSVYATKSIYAGDKFPVTDNYLFEENPEVVGMAGAINYGQAAKLDSLVEGCVPLTVKFKNWINVSDLQWNFGNGTTSNSASPTYTYDQPGTYIVSSKAKGANGQDLVRTDTIVVYEKPVAYFDLRPDTIVASKSPVRMFNLSSGTVKYLWDFGDKSNSEEEQPLHYYNQAGTYDLKLCAWNITGCADSMTILKGVTVLKYPEEVDHIEFPSVFGQGASTNAANSSNLLFKPTYFRVAQYKLSIYSLQGQLVFVSVYPEEGWDGSINGSSPKSATYIWKASGQYVGGKQYNLTGRVLFVK